jgi:mannose-1-phosphate guanylyltransferase/mannose-1-phosphate guanylyltransferase/mannose-6-phosphate isomerase
VVISGGSGTRLWPVSRKAFPKQFCDLLDESLFLKAVKRLSHLGSPWTVTVADLKVHTDRTAQMIGLPKDQIIYEPVARNTAPALALLCHVLKMRGFENEVAGVFPADHLIDDEDEFMRVVRLGAELARGDEIVTLGVKPHYPATGYGYIEVEGQVAGQTDKEARRAVRFCEKPNLETAERFLASGNYLWNAGMFIFRVGYLIKLFQKNLPDLWRAISTVKLDLSNLTSVYAQLKSESFDYGIMEKLSGHLCIPCDLGWSDIGSWDAISDFINPESAQFKEQSKNVVDLNNDNFVYPVEEKIYGLVGVSDLIVVDTPDALLIVKKGETEKVKDLVERLKREGRVAADQHTFEYRPWGRFEVLKYAENFKSKVISIDPGAQFSLQSHARRSEHWIVVRGKGEATIGEDVVAVQAGRHVFVPQGSQHRMKNTGLESLDFVEVQFGSYLGEDDIVRYQDDYNRK